MAGPKNVNEVVAFTTYAKERATSYSKVSTELVCSNTTELRYGATGNPPFTLIFGRLSRLGQYPSSPRESIPPLFRSSYPLCFCLVAPER